MKATFGAGCFWGVQSIFDSVKGVISSEVGFMGGNVKNPSYERVCEGDTNHAEVVQLEFDPKIISYEKLVEKFFDMHDPTQGNRQGADVGSQYRSVIFYHTLSQKKTAELVMKKAQNKFESPITTQIVKAAAFYKAEEYHQMYFKKHKILRTIHKMIGNTC